MKPSHYLLGAIALLPSSIGALESAQAQAVTVVAAPAAQCLVPSKNFEIGQNGAINYSDVFTRHISCGFGFSAKGWTVNVDYTDAHTWDQIFCTLKVLSWNGQTVRYTSHVTSPRGVQKTGVFSFAVPAGTTGYGKLDCQLPPTNPGDNARSGILGFRYGAGEQ
jgi:hypothetical protein